MKEEIAKCPTCGYSLTREQLYGLYLRCPACLNEYRYQDGILSTFETIYYPPDITWEEFLVKVFSPIASRLPRHFFEEMQDISSNEAYIPYVDVVTEKRQTYLMAVPHLGNKSEWKDNEFPTISDHKHFKKLKGAERHEEIAEPKPSDVIMLDSDMLSTLRRKEKYVGDKLMYIPVKTIGFEYRGKTYRFTALGCQVIAMGEPITTIAPEKPVKKKQGLPWWMATSLFLLMLAVMVSAWIKYCYSFQQLNGFIKLFVFKSGYECLFRFLGISALAILGYSAVYGMMASVLSELRVSVGCFYKKTNTSRLTKLALRKFNR